MADARARAEQVIRRFLEMAEREVDTAPGVELFGEGLGLDSLETAELSASLEDELGRDPFSDGRALRTIGEVLDYYAENAPVAS